MEPLGVHVAIAAWIDQHRAYDGFAAVPATPVQFTPTAILPLIESQDAFRQAELVRMANLVPRKGKVAEPFGPSAPLWEHMSDVLDRMVFARRALTDAEAAALDGARKVLYVDDGANRLRPSPQFNSYLEMRSVVQALQDSGAAAELQQAALSDWLTLGFKNEVEQALADVTRLASRSSVVEAMSCRAQLEETMLLSAGDISYAPTSFYPLSAANAATWTLAEVTLDELSEGAARTFPASPVTLGSASAAKCRFAYTAIDTLRPWSLAQLLSRDDWKLSAGELVSDGDGVNGTIPAYVQTIYAATIIGLSATPPPRPRWPTGSLEPLVRSGELRFNPSRRVVPKGIGTPVAPQNAKPADAPLGAGNAGGVLAGRVVLQPSAEVPPFGGMAQRSRDLALVRRFQVPLNRSEWLARLAIAQTGRPVTDGEPSPAPGEPATVDLSAGANIVGFGCVPVPPAPRPNEQYQW
jgi:hypothetical protein